MNWKAVAGKVYWQKMVYATLQLGHLPVGLALGGYITKKSIFSVTYIKVGFKGLIPGEFLLTWKQNI